MIKELQLLRDEVVQCIQCPDLVANRTQTVFGVGKEDAKLMVIGEAPGKNEDEKGEPFVGEAGKLLDNILKACGWSREQLYIANVCKCRPPSNRRPSICEQTNCRDAFLLRQIEIINPKFLLLLGATATEAMFGLPFHMVRGTMKTLGDRKVMCSYHPAYLLRNPAAKKDVWEHVCVLKEAIDADGGM